MHLDIWYGDLGMWYGDLGMGPGYVVWGCGMYVAFLLCAVELVVL